MQIKNDLKFISIEGIDFIGKTTLCKKLWEDFSSNYSVILFSDPPKISPWNQLKEMFEHDQEINQLGHAFLLLSARIDNYHRIILPHLENDGFVIGDRYIDSWFIYQSLFLSEYFGGIENALMFLIKINNLLLEKKNY